MKTEATNSQQCWGSLRSRLFFSCSRTIPGGRDRDINVGQATGQQDTSLSCILPLKHRGILGPPGDRCSPLWKEKHNTDLIYMWVKSKTPIKHVRTLLSHRELLQKPHCSLALIQLEPWTLVILKIFPHLAVWWWRCRAPFNTSHPKSPSGVQLGWVAVTVKVTTNDSHNFHPHQNTQWPPRPLQVRVVGVGRGGSHSVSPLIFQLLPFNISPVLRFTKN